ncbi:nucleoside triphosphate pyrophosphohydrolase [Candidatus Sumerlaeota bacterium]|nr:nucleoside triphosphate pyrophosphohydrolase [Candidatus Sumerlaeota bacterium]MBI3736980.1 nucleoside triphosphate pyrophosphohydrolase [Candidatus Sumerlaeota bacterium]
MNQTSAETTNSTPLEARDFSRADIEAIADPVARLRVLMKRLLDPGGCPWDREQTHQTLKQYMIEEAHEVCEAIEAGDDVDLCEELGDVALQVIFHAELAERERKFTLEDVYDAICKKLLDRHPHVFGEVKADTADAVLKNWEQLKKEEKRLKAEARGQGRKSILAGVPASLPALQRAQRLQEKASRVGFDWEKTEDVAKKVREEVEEFLAESSVAPNERLEEELGDLLFSLVNIARFLKLNPEEALRQSCRKFMRRFHNVEEAAEAMGRELNQLTLAEMDAIWDEAKRRE